ncbi:hypothetical protein SAMN05192532_101541 [Alteribacillus iranensis]|uniref:Uncharacterized protein n=1 Tax=Alteribacillus iranensis TaxID=930128 RepID=A0A1I1ZYW2_9BACI|nr:hypothetical protein SAMN05192532_101541 [Alteribacillus iranensis]
MQITDKAKEYIEDVMKEQNVSTLRVVFSGYG